MKYFFLFLSFVLFVLTAAGRNIADSVVVNGKVHYYRMLMPDNLDKDAPLVVLLHGYGGADYYAPTCMDSVAMADGFALCVPLGLKGPDGKRSWNVGYPMQEGWKEDDVDNLCRITRHVQKKYALSAENTFLTGMSNGGEMCYLMVYRNVTVFRAIASVAGLTMKWMYKKLNPVHQVPFMEIHGTEDRVSEWGGDLDNKGGWGAYMPVPIAVGRVVALNRCTHECTEYAESKDATSAHRIVRHLFFGGDNGCDVWLYEVVGATHCWHTADMDTGEEIWKFFSQYVK